MLGVIMILLVILSMLGVGMLGLSGQDAVETSRAISTTRAFWAAEAGIAAMRAVAYSNREPLDDLGLLGENVMQGTIGQGQYSVDVADDPD